MSSTPSNEPASPSPSSVAEDMDNLQLHAQQFVEEDQDERSQVEGEPQRPQAEGDPQPQPPQPYPVAVPLDYVRPMDTLEDLDLPPAHNPVAPYHARSVSLRGIRLSLQACERDAWLSLESRFLRERLAVVAKLPTTVARQRRELAVNEERLKEYESHAHIDRRYQRLKLEERLAMKQQRHDLVDQTMQVLVITPENKTLTVDVSIHMTVAQLKSKIEGAHRVPVAMQRLLCETKELDDRKTLGDYNVIHGATIGMMFSLPGGADSPGPSTILWGTMQVHVYIPRSVALAAPRLFGVRQRFTATRLHEGEPTWQDDYVFDMLSRTSFPGVCELYDGCWLDGCGRTQTALAAYMYWDVPHRHVTEVAVALAYLAEAAFGTPFVTYRDSLGDFGLRPAISFDGRSDP